jgi:hypothetical protein
MDEMWKCGAENREKPASDFWAKKKLHWHMPMQL